MSPGKLEDLMKSLGWVYILGLALRVSVDGRDVLLPLFAVWSFVLLGRLGSDRTLGDTSWFTVARVSAAGVAGAGFLSWVPAVEPGAMAVVIIIGVSVGSAGYAGALEHWCVSHGWNAQAAVARSAVRWMLAATLGVAAAVVMLVAWVSAGPPNPDSSFTPSVVLGRPLGGIGVTAGFLGTGLVLFVATLRLRKASRLTRRGLSALRVDDLAGG